MHFSALFCTIFRQNACKMHASIFQSREERWVFIMATTKLWLDTRSSNKKKQSPIKVLICAKRQTALISTGAYADKAYWDADAEKVFSIADRNTINTKAASVKCKVDEVILKLSLEGRLASMSAAEIRDAAMEIINPSSLEKKRREKLFEYRFLQFANLKKASTRTIYMHTHSRMAAFAGTALGKLSFEDITKEWLTKFDAFLQKTSPSKNARNIHLRNIRAVFNDAIDDEITHAYPFRRFKIRPVPTAKRSLSVDELRTLFAMKTDECSERYLDMFKLVFFLIGINMIDLCGLKEIVGGRVEYNRSKTSRLYSIRVEPEAQAIIEKYRGKNYLLDIMDTNRNHKHFLKHMNDCLQNLGDTKILPHGKKVHNPLFPKITSYWARHSWATVAASLDIPKETIAAALGHGGNTVTDIYIDFDRRKIDEANRRVIDWVLYGIR